MTDLRETQTRVMPSQRRELVRRAARSASIARCRSASVAASERGRPGVDEATLASAIDIDAIGEVGALVAIGVAEHGERAAGDREVLARR